MQQVIIAIHLMVVTALVILVLYQKSEGGALGMGGSGVFTGRGQANALTRATGILATIFFLTSIALTVLPAWERRAAGGDDWTKAIDQGDLKFKEIKPGEKDQKAPEPGKESVFEQLQRAQQKRQQGAPAAPGEEKPALRPSQEPPKAEAPKAEAPKPEAVKPEDAKPAEAPKAAAPAAEPPKAAAPSSPVTEAPKAETPKTDAAKPAEAPKAEAPKAEAPSAPAPAEKPAAPPSQWKSPTQ
ncbi:MAG TPA: preprotein translocase subunit SecG [Methylocystis sp.]